LKVGHVLGESALLFEKIEDNVIDDQVAKLHKKTANIEASESEPPSTPLKNEIVFDDFTKLDMRVGTVLTAEAMKGSNKLLKLLVDIGFEKRTILSGIAQHYKPEEILGKQVIVIANLTPRRMMGIESQGMILMTEEVNGKLRFLRPDENVQPGSVVS
jgi:methionyl-tRNA synthetase